MLMLSLTRTTKRSSTFANRRPPPFSPPSKTSSNMFLSPENPSFPVESTLCACLSYYTGCPISTFFKSASVSLKCTQSSGIGSTQVLAGASFPKHFYPILRSLRAKLSKIFLWCPSEKYPAIGKQRRLSNFSHVMLCNCELIT